MLTFRSDVIAISQQSVPQQNSFAAGSKLPGSHPFSKYNIISNNVLKIEVLYAEIQPKWKDNPDDSPI